MKTKQMRKMYIPTNKHTFMFTVCTPDYGLPDTDEDERRTRKMYIPMTKHTFVFTVYSPDDNLPDTDEDGADEEGVHSYDQAHVRVHRVHR